MKTFDLNKQADRNIYAESDEERRKRKEVEGKLMAMDMFNNGKPVTFKLFKERANVSKYGKKALYIIFIGDPNQNMFGFYPEISTKEQATKDAYKSYCKLVNGDISELEDGIDVSWGDCGYPLVYKRLRVRTYAK